MKGTFHKSCSCRSCRRGRSAHDRALNERKLRRKGHGQVVAFLKGIVEDVFIAPIASPYTD